MIGALSTSLAVAFAAAPDGAQAGPRTPAPAASDREQILRHIHSIFRAYLDQDRDALRRTHTADWTGFQGPSVQIERGIEAYMANAEKSLQHLRGTGYQLLDTEIQIYGDLALVYYVARYDYRDLEGRDGSIPLRSVDIYRRETGGWNQAGSHICVIPTGGDWGPDDQDKRDTSKTKEGAPTGAAAVTADAGNTRVLSDQERNELFAAREAVWRAWFTHDASMLRERVPADAIAIDPGVAAWADQNEILRRSTEFASGGATLLRLEFPETRLQVYGDVVILYTRFLFETQRGAERSVTTGRGTEVFVQRDGKWLNTGWHLERQP